eukprot:gnl/TRDRNA2_/TRDRNA2_153593_c0_seq3.p1 gnl/TRDRNA2_/TRDRNA2_153593_c0~~gnl/TRDRNA2_/TRDRNA2_153593_c0_seq3.p1  ORF type:complete len:398 (+),score=56.39 gnl/TRDRNA2_/TRDRNA2_153593_c0_seq3:66-1259(+)
MVAKPQNMLTTVQLQNISDTNTNTLLAMLDQSGYKGRCGFNYVPSHCQDGVNLGCATLTFFSHEEASRFIDIFDLLTQASTVGRSGGSTATDTSQKVLLLPSSYIFQRSQVLGPADAPSYKGYEADVESMLPKLTPLMAAMRTHGVPCPDTEPKPIDSDLSQIQGQCRVDHISMTAQKGHMRVSGKSNNGYHPGPKQGTCSKHVSDGVTGSQYHAQTHAASADADVPNAQSAITLILDDVRVPFPTPHDCSRQLDEWGFGGMYNYVFVPREDASDDVVYVNFVASQYASLCRNFAKATSHFTAELAPLQGILANTSYWSMKYSGEELAIKQLMMPTHQQVERQQKTKLCTFHLNKSCKQGAAWQFVHSEAELTLQTDLQKTNHGIRLFRESCKAGGC